MKHEHQPRDFAVERYLLHEMTAAEQEAFEEHYFECSLCAEDLRAASQFIDDAQQVLSVGPAPSLVGSAPPASRWSWLAWLQPQFAAAAIVVLLVVSGGVTMNTLSLRQQLDVATAPYLVGVVALRPLTRGEPVIVPTGSGEPVVLRFDLPPTEITDFRVEIRSADGDVVLRLPDAAVPASGEVTLSIPRFDLPTGSYNLIVDASTTSGARQQLGEYPLEVTGVQGDR